MPEVENPEGENPDDETDNKGFGDDESDFTTCDFSGSGVEGKGSFESILALFK